jgi:hypothetical protein
LQEAARLTSTERRAVYGDVLEDFSRAIGALNSLLAKKLAQPLDITDAPVIQIVFKLSRMQNKVHRDGWRDIAGYAQCGDEVSEYGE